MIDVRDARESDAAGIREVFRAIYGEDYPYRDFYLLDNIKRMIFSDTTVLVVAVDSETDRILGSASVLESRGAFSDLVGEFGRLAVHPEFRNRGLGGLLMAGRLERVQKRLHVGVSDVRIVHPYSVRIGHRFGFHAVGYVPAKIKVIARENVLMMGRHFGRALDLRKNHPRIIPEAYQLAHVSMDNCGIRFDAVVDESSPPYTSEDEFTVEELTTEGYADLLRIPRGRVKNREIFGPMRLHYGIFKLQAKNSVYLLAKSGGHLEGAIGFTIDHTGQSIRIFELISLGNRVIRFLLTELLRRAQHIWDIEFIELNVSAHAPRMQRTLIELGFLPVAFIPALVFHDVERLDIIKMVRVFVPIDTSEDCDLPNVKPVIDLVLKSFLSREIQPRLLEAVNRVEIFRDLSEEQTRTLAAYGTINRFARNELLFQVGETSDRIFLILSGKVEIRMPSRSKPVGTVGPGECLGEISALSQIPHTASAKAMTPVLSGEITMENLNQVIRLRPDIGVLVYRNLAIGLGDKLYRTDISRGEK